MDVHGPYNAPRSDYEAVLRQMDGGGSRTLTEEEYARIPRYLRRTAWATKEERYRLESWRAKYGAGVHAFDRAVGPFLEELRTSGVLDRAYFVLTADHGEELMEHGGWNHGTNLYDHQLHVPLLIRKPLAEDAGRRVASLVSLIDLMPTLSGLGRVDVPAGTLGRDFSGTLRGAGDEGAVAVFASAVNEHPGVLGVRTLERKLIWDEERDAVELYDLAADPKECRDRSGESGPLVAQLKGFLGDERKRILARGVLVPEAIPMDDELRDRLKALGYVR
jgi:arylsulfatase A-like enzyme